MVNWLIKLINLLRDPEVKLRNKLVFLIPIVYLLIPHDFIPSYIPFIGLIDDLLVFLVMLPIFNNILSKHNNSGNGYDKKRGKDIKNTVDMDKDDYEVK